MTPSKTKAPIGNPELNSADRKTGGFHEEGVQDRFEIYAHATQMQLIAASILTCYNMLSFDTWMMLHVWIRWEV